MPEAVTLGKAGIRRDNYEIPASTASVTTDGVTIQGDGTLGNPIAIKQVEHDGTLTGAGTLASPLKVAKFVAQGFDYVATGAEGDTFTVTIPGGPRADASYIALVTGGAGANTLTTYATDTYTAANFRLRMGIAPALADVIHVVLVEKL